MAMLICIIIMIHKSSKKREMVEKKTRTNEEEIVTYARGTSVQPNTRLAFKKAQQSHLFLACYLIFMSP